MIDARLEGGPFDGAVDEVSYPRSEVVAWKCPYCGQIHIWHEGPPSAERYRYDHKDGPFHVYVYGELNFAGNGNREKELVGV